MQILLTVFCKWIWASLFSECSSSIHLWNNWFSFLEGPQWTEKNITHTSKTSSNTPGQKVVPISRLNKLQEPAVAWSRRRGLILHPEVVDYMWERVSKSSNIVELRTKNLTLDLHSLQKMISEVEFHWAGLLSIHGRPLWRPSPNVIVNFETTAPCLVSIFLAINAPCYKMGEDGGRGRIVNPYKCGYWNNALVYYPAQCKSSLPPHPPLLPNLSAK